MYLIRLKLLAVFLGAVFLLFVFFPAYNYKINVDLSVAETGQSAVYFSTKDGYFNSSNFAYLKYDKNCKLPCNSYHAVFTSKDPIRSIRLDPTNTVGPIAISNISVELNGQESIQIDLTKSIKKINLMDDIKEGKGVLMANSIGDDPYLELNLDASGKFVEKPYLHYFIIVLMGALSAGAFYLFIRVKPCLKNVLDIVTRSAWLRNVEKWFDSEGLIKFSSIKVIAIVALGFLVFILAVYFKLNLSAIGVWNDYYKHENIESTVLYGEPKAIRSDEWYVHTPWVLNQALNDFPMTNPNIGLRGAPLLVSAPVDSPLMLAQPKYWGFLFFEIDRGFSWYWFVKAFGLFFAAFFFFLILTKNDFEISIAGSLLVYSSSYIQWWFSAFTPEIATAFFVIMIGVYYMIRGGVVGSIVGSAIYFAGSANMLMNFYPPHIANLAYLGLFFGASILWSDFHKKEFKNFAIIKLSAFSIATIGIFVFLYFVVSAAWPAIEVMMNTEYPGRRYSVGGGVPLSSFLMGLFEFWRDGYFYPSFGGNQSESARFIYFFPVALLAFIQYRKIPAESVKIIFSLFIFSILSVFWMAHDGDGIFYQLMARAGWYLIPSNRAHFGLGLASLILMVILFSTFFAVGGLARRQIFAYTIVFNLFLISAWIYLNKLDPVFFSPGNSWVQFFILNVVFISIVSGVRQLFFVGAVAASIFTLQVNPITAGLGSVWSKQVFTQASEISSKTNDFWVVYGDLKISQGMRSVGLNVLNGVQYSPDQNILLKFDPESKNKYLWNRYANMGFLMPESAGVVFESHYPDQYQIKVDPCFGAFAELGVTHYAFAGIGFPKGVDCLKLTKSYPDLDLYYFVRK
jgi:hypothetical protein